MPRIPRRLAPVLSAALAATLTAAPPRAARATIGGGLGGAGFSLFLYEICAPLGGTRFLCSQTGVRVDPVGDVKHVSMTLDYDWSGPNFTFNPGLSGPLGIFSVGGSAPPATPGAGVQPFTIFAAPPDTPGAQLPGSVLTIVDNGLAVSIDYQLAAPISAPVETNFFVFVFDHPAVVVNTAFDAVEYSPGLLPGADFVVFDPVCESGDPAVPGCGSTVPAMSARLNLVPEPSAAALLAGGVAALAGAAARRRRARTA